MVQGSIHSGSDATAIYNFLDGSTVTSFHTYTLDWATNAILFYVDGHLYETQTSWGSSTTNAFPFPFNKPFFLLMNLAIGGNYLNNPSVTAINAGTSFPAQYLVDYVRLYAPTSPLVLNLQRAGKQYTLTWPSNIVCNLQALTNLLQNNSNNWASVTTQTNQFPLTPSNPTTFYRLVSP
jgi:beta-glucanase (GH16 family)